MTCVPKEIKTKMEQEQAMTTAKNAVFIGLYFENCRLVAGELTLWGMSIGGGMTKFFGWWPGPSPSPQ